MGKTKLRVDHPGNGHSNVLTGMVSGMGFLATPARYDPGFGWLNSVPRGRLKSTIPRHADRGVIRWSGDHVTGEIATVIWMEENQQTIYD